MTDEVLTSPPKRPVAEIKPPAAQKPKRPAAQKSNDQVLSKEPELPVFLPPKAPGEMEPFDRPSLTVQKPGEEPVTEAMEQKVWDVRRQEYVEPYRKAGVPAKPAEDAQAQKFPSRAEFEDHAFNALGGNPFEIDPVQSVKQATADLRPLFNYIFGNRVYWGDRDRLSPEQDKFWDDTVKAYRAQIFQEAESQRATQIDVYNQMMSRFDNEQKEQQAAGRKITEQSRAVLAGAKERRSVEAAGRAEAREERSIAASERAAEAAQRAEDREARMARAAEWKKQQDIMKGLKPKEPSRSDVQAIAKAEFAEFDAVDVEDNFIMERDEDLGPGVYKNALAPKTLKSLNAARKAAGLPELHEIVTTVADGNRYQYLEAPEAEFDKEVKKQYPNAVKYGDAYWALLPDGQYRKITAGE